MQHFNSQQRAAVLHRHSPLLVLAGAGSGKTGVITHKIAHLVRDVGLPPETVYAVTFTNKAAREMQERCKKLLHSLADRLPIFTFHRLGLEIIRRHHGLLGLRANFCILDAHDVANIIKELSQSNDEAKVKSIQSLISQYKNEGITPQEALLQELDYAGMYASYEERLRAYNVLDFDDLLLQPLRLFQEQPEALQLWQARIRYLLVDEYQDTNGCQYDLMKRLIGKGSHLTVVGDDDQSIYAWRGARPENLIHLQEDYPDLSVIKLEQNYRCHQAILQAANVLIAHNPRFSEKRLWSSLSAGKGLSVHRYRDEREEALHVVREIDNLIKVYRWKASDFAILYRSNAQATVFEEALREKRLDYEISGGTSFFDHSEIRDLVAYLRLINNPYDDAAFIRICNTPKREIGVKTIEKLSAYALRRQQALFIAAQEVALMEELTPQAYQYLNAFIRWIERLQRDAANEPAAIILQKVFEQSEYEHHLYDLYGEAKRVEKRLNRIHGLKKWMQNLGENEEALLDLSALMNHLNLRDVLSRQNQQQDAVQLMTLHSAKGLEFRQVFLVGCEEELLPHANSGESIEEERRLMYVGMTRAKEHLQISYCQNRGGMARKGKEGSASKGNQREPSRFLEELPREGITWLDGRHEMDEAEAKRFRQDSFNDLLSMLEGDD